MLADDIFLYLKNIGQPHLAVGLEALPMPQLEAFFVKLKSYGLKLLIEQREAFFRPNISSLPEPLETYEVADNLKSMDNIACLILCGGQGSRLGTADPKGLVPVSPVKGKSLLQLFCEKTVAASLKAGRPLSLAIMTSPFNREKITEYLAQNNYFGAQVDIYSQEILPFLDDRGNWLLEAPGKLAEGPDGNGHALKGLVASGIWEKWKQRGIEFVNVIPIDNPLADPFDPRHEGEVTIRAIFRHDPKEKVGVIGVSNNKISVVEYSDLPANAPHYKIANISLFCFSMDFIKKISTISLPWHLARKQASVLLGTAKGVCVENARVWKFETFIFDLLDYAEKVKVLVYPREHTYAPLKNASGEKSIETVQAALLAADRRIYENISGLQPPQQPFELDQTFHYPTPDLLDKWRGKPLPVQV